MINKSKATLANLRSRRKLCDSQWEKLLPPSGDPQDSNTFDITLLHLLLREICTVLIEPATGWHDMPAETDHSREAEIVQIKCIRNSLCHSISTGVPNDEFEDKWNTISFSLVALGLDRLEIDRLKTENVDYGTQRRVEEEVEKWKLDIEPRVQISEHEVRQLKLGRISTNKQPISELGGSLDLPNCLPDEDNDLSVEKAIKTSFNLLTEAEQKALAIMSVFPGSFDSDAAEAVITAVMDSEVQPVLILQSLRNSYACFLSAPKLLPSRLQMVSTVYEIALILCRKNLDEHPETAVTLQYIGRHLKSLQHLQDAMEMFNRCLREHFMADLSHKGIADFYFGRFFSRKENTDMEKCFEHYEAALTLMSNLGVGDHKESILTLKNYGVCWKNKGNYQEAISILTKAKQVVDIELEEDHKWKVMIETQLALVYDCVGNAEEA
ncbi:E3 ubiquitin-protein ligase DZIP3 [Stylophora pistillata]|uniref:E3 ubiquitin-protein ligase DZIP3 n=1 Tax=Stylophora pistillata TaxID=50429 RepID=A0A2B4R6T9_STYPI|nr:E3 ubiquitin-protein ligase DZIP3 [Stylophora pistillata]